ncbi:MAG: TlpA disulfide reductase family protein [Arachidicoccus sp.]|nr:TlpA disulfide reductase family protein [Arachidicoccus sp.]
MRNKKKSVSTYFLILILGFIIFSDNYSCASQVHYEKDLVDVKKKDSIYLFSSLLKRESIYYNDCPQGLQQIFMNPNDSIVIESYRKQFIFQPDKNQNFYVVYPNDRLKIREDSSGNFIFKTITKDSIRDNELDLMRQANLTLKESFGSLINEAFNNKTKQYSSEIFDKYTHDISDFINTYKQNKTISRGFEKDLNNFIKCTMLNSQIGSALNAKTNITTQVQDSLDSLFNSSHYTDNSDEYFTSLAYSYMYYQTLHNANEYDYNKISFENMYDLTNKTLKDSITKDAVLLSIINSQISKIGMDKSSSMIRKFLTDCKKKEYLDYINNMVFQNEKLTQANRDSVLDLNLYTQNISSILKANIGKLIYIDCWASWCAPCRANIPKERELENHFANSSIVFMYLSIDKNIDDWKRAVQEEKLEKSRYNYLVGSPDQSSFAKKFKINTIPRYILIGKDGKVISADAPHPSDKALQELIEKNL